MDFGIFDWIDSTGSELADLYESRLKLLEFADQAGFYCYHLAEHQATPLGMAPSPGVLRLQIECKEVNEISRPGPLHRNLPILSP